MIMAAGWAARGPAPPPELSSTSRTRRADRPVGTRASGPLLFARYAYPPNALGLCGPDAVDELAQRLAGGGDDPDLRALLRGFEGAWPYLELIAAAAGIPDPLDRRVVQAYWVGNPLLATVPLPTLGESLRSRFARRLTPAGWSGLAESLGAGAMPHHSTHVFLVYPWVGLLRGGRTAEPLHVLDRCRIRWAQVAAVTGDSAVVTYEPLAWDGRRLSLGRSVTEQVRLGPHLTSAAATVHDPGAPPPLSPGDWIACHWDWACDRLDPSELAALRRWSTHTLALVNAHPSPAPAHVLA
jgi:Family of unknown function (DUF6390)